MKTKTEIVNYLIKYLHKKGIEISVSKTGYIFWNYEKHYSKLEVELDCFKKQYNDFHTIKYYTNYSIWGVGRRRTKLNGNFGLRVYKNLQYIKKVFDEIAEDEKFVKESKINYCAELKSHYEKKHEIVDIDVHKGVSGIIIEVKCVDRGKSYTQYSILFSENKYYLQHKIENFENNKNKYVINKKVISL